MIHPKNDNMKKEYQISVFDTNIFLTGIDFNIFKSIIYTTPNVIEEVKASKYMAKNRNILNKIHAAIESGKLRIKSPTMKFIQDVDYSIENVCSEFNIPYTSLYKEGIDKKIIWEVFCPNCETIHKPEDLNKFCEICGLKLKRRPKNNIIY